MIKFITDTSEFKDIKIKNFDVNDYIKFLKKGLGEAEFNAISDYILHKARQIVKNDKKDGVTAFKVSTKTWQPPIDKIYTLFAKTANEKSEDDIYTYSAHALGCMLYNVILHDDETWYVIQSNITQRDFTILCYFKRGYL